MMAKESLTPVQSGLKGINAQKEVVAFLRWGISAKAPGEGSGQAKGILSAGLQLSGSTLPDSLL